MNSTLFLAINFSSRQKIRSRKKNDSLKSVEFIINIQISGRYYTKFCSLLSEMRLNRHCYSYSWHISSFVCWMLARRSRMHLIPVQLSPFLFMWFPSRLALLCTHIDYCVHVYVDLYTYTLMGARVRWRVHIYVDVYTYYCCNVSLQFSIR
jgi:hypothetical protein